MINENILKLTGQANIPSPLTLGKDYDVKSTVNIQSTRQIDNGDGTMNIIYVAKQTGIAEIINEKKQSIKTKDNRKKSQKLRGAIWFEWNGGYTNEDPEKFYDKTMDLLITNLPSIIKKYDFQQKT